MYETLSISCCRWMKLYKLCLSQKKTLNHKKSFDYEYKNVDSRN